MIFSLVLLILAQAPPPSVEERAVAYLAAEVPRWHTENHCFSCHNNGDGARALYVAQQLSFNVPPDALKETTDWIGRPQQWDENHGTAGFSDKKLERIQLSGSLVAAHNAGVASGDAVVKAAEILAPLQEKDGSWQVRAETVVGTPATYGAVLATTMARETLIAAGDTRFADAIGRAEMWLINVQVSNVMDSAAVVLGLSDSKDPRALQKTKEALEFIGRAQLSYGGWGPFPDTPPEAFDTAVSLLALAKFRDQPEISDRIKRGREFLESIQFSGGGWPETTRPSGRESYAQHISTSAWATLAMLKTR